MDTLKSIEDAFPLSDPREAVGAPGGRAALMAFVNDAQSEASLRECVKSLSLPEARIVRTGILGAIRHLGAARSPKILIVDISGVDMAVSRIHELAELCEPAVTVIAIGTHNDIGLYRDLIRAGVTEYIVKPTTAQLFRKALSPRPVDGQPSPISRKLGTVVAVIGARGGVGATTVAANLAWYLAHRQNRRVALVDFDLQNGDCALCLNLTSGTGLREALTNPLRIDRVFLERAMARLGERLFVLSSEEPLTDDVAFAPDAVMTLIDMLQSQFHYVVADVPRIPLPPYRLILNSADRRVIVADQTLRSVRDTARLCAALGESNSLRNLLVVNRAGEGGRHAVTLQEVERFGTLHPKIVVPFLPALFAARAERGQVVAARRGKFAQALGALSFELSGRMPERRRWLRGAA
jgi:pilus assembly protein CpaE